MLSPPVPFPLLKSPPCMMKSFTTRWNMTPWKSHTWYLGGDFARGTVRCSAAASSSSPPRPFRRCTDLWNSHTSSALRCRTTRKRCGRREGRRWICRRNTSYLWDSRRWPSNSELKLLSYLMFLIVTRAASLSFRFSSRNFRTPIKIQEITSAQDPEHFLN